LIMSAQKSEKKKISFKNLVGVLTVLLVAAYFIFMFVNFQKQKSISFYEVEEGSIVKERSYQGIILRNETVIASESSGYVNFYITDGKKVSMNSRVYSIDENGDLKKFLQSHAEELQKISNDKLESLHSSIMQEARSFDPSDFKNAYIFREQMESNILGITGNDILSRLSDEIKAAGIRYNDYRTNQTGVVCYTIDGFEGKTKSDITVADFDRSNYKPTRLKSNDLISAGTPVYKLISEENWEIIFQLNSEDISELAGKESLNINFKNHGIQTSAGFETFKNSDGETLGCLKLKKYMIRFINDRYVDFEIVTNNVSGLKIPEKSITSKDFYKIPVSLIMKDNKGNTGVQKVSIGNGNNTYSFILVESYMEDDSYSYINLTENSDLKAGDYIGDPDNPSFNYKVEDVKGILDAYNINKGYAVFKRIEELERANGYCIIKKNTPYGLTVYDHIILDASTVEEGEILY